MGKSGVAVVAIGGNSLITDQQHEDVQSQMHAIEDTCRHIAAMVAEGWNLVVTHGNGPQVGFAVRRYELAAHEVPPSPLDVIVADTQGSIGYAICQALRNEYRRRGISKPVVAVVTQTLVDPLDDAFQHPSKGIGSFMAEERARSFAQAGWAVREDAGRGWRRLVASPQPIHIIELGTIEQLVHSGATVVAVGGGGIPVIENEDGMLRGCRAVVDKDRASSLLATGLGADLLLISTGVDRVALNFNKPGQRWLDCLTLSEAKRFLADGHFLDGSMGPKIEAIIHFLEANHHGRAVITNPANINRALDGKAGTWIMPDDAPVLRTWTSDARCTALPAVPTPGCP
jgi:carbamate kinase